MLARDHSWQCRIHHYVLNNPGHVPRVALDDTVVIDFTAKWLVSDLLEWCERRWPSTTPHDLTASNRVYGVMHGSFRPRQFASATVAAATGVLLSTRLLDSPGGRDGLSLDYVPHDNADAHQPIARLVPTDGYFRWRPHGTRLSFLPSFDAVRKDAAECSCLLDPTDERRLENLRTLARAIMLCTPEASDLVALAAVVERDYNGSNMRRDQGTKIPHGYFKRVFLEFLRFRGVSWYNYGHVQAHLADAIVESNTSNAVTSGRDISYDHRYIFSSYWDKRHDAAPLDWLERYLGASSATEQDANHDHDDSEGDIKSAAIDPSDTPHSSSTASDGKAALLKWHWDSQGCLLYTSPSPRD